MACGLLPLYSASLNCQSPCVVWCNQPGPPLKRPAEQSLRSKFSKSSRRSYVVLAGNSRLKKCEFFSIDQGKLCGRLRRRYAMGNAWMRADGARKSILKIKMGIQSGEL